MTLRDIRKIARLKCASVLEQTVFSGDLWTYTGINNAPLSPDEEVLMAREIKRVAMSLRGLKAPSR